VIDDIESFLSSARQARAAGRVADAQHDYERAAELARTVGNNQALAHALRHISDIDRENGRPVEAFAAGRNAVEIYRALAGTPRLDLANALRLTGLAAQAPGEIDEAFSIWREARLLYVQAGVQAGVEECEIHLSRIGSLGPSQSNL